MAMLSPEKLEGLRRSVVTFGISKEQTLELIESHLEALQVIETRNNSSQNSSEIASIREKPY